MLMHDQHIYKSQWSLQITFTLTDFLQSGVEKLLAWAGRD